MFRCLNTFYVDPKTGKWFFVVVVVFRSFVLLVFFLRESSSYGIGILCNMNTL